MTTAIERYVARAHRRPGRNGHSQPGGAAPPIPLAVEEPAAGGPGLAGLAAIEPREVRVDLCQAHPANRRPSKPQIARLAESLRTEGQLEPIVVRPWSGPAGSRYQIISGETRWLAACRLGWTTLRARVVELDDARALTLLAEHNGARHDLDPIQRARLIQQLGLPLAEGGAALSREAAARLVGLDSGAAASNLVRLLDLPPVWQERVASGALPQTFARELLPLAEAPKLLGLLEPEWTAWVKHEARRAAKPDGEHPTASCFRSRGSVALEVRRVIDRQLRPLDAKRPYWHTPLDAKRRPVYAAGHHHRRRFELTDAVRARLDVATVLIDGERVEVAQHVEAFDRLNDPLLLAAAEKKSKNRAARAGRDEEPREKTPADKRAATKQAAAQLAKRIQRWRYRWLCALAAERVDDHTALKLVAYRLLGEGDNRLEALSVDAFIGLAEQARQRVDDWAGLDRWEPFHHDRGSCVAVHATLIDWARALLLRVAAVEGEYPPIPVADVEALAAELRVDLAAAWKAACGTQEGRARIKEFLLLHQTSQLAALADELGIDVEACGKKHELVSLLLKRAAAKPLRFPKALAATKKGR